MITTENLLPACDIDKPYIFVSYAHQNSETVQQIMGIMQKAGVRVWYDEGIEYSEDFAEVLEERIAGCSFLLAFITKEFVESKWCRNEVAYADNSENSIKVLLAYLEETKLKNGMGLRFADNQSIFMNSHRSLESFTATLVKWIKEKYPETVEIPEADVAGVTSVKAKVEIINEAEVKPEVNVSKEPEVKSPTALNIAVNNLGATVKTSGAAEAAKQDEEFSDADFDGKEYIRKHFAPSLFHDLILAEDFLSTEADKKEIAFKPGNFFRNRMGSVVPLKDIRKIIFMCLILLGFIGSVGVLGITREYAFKEFGNSYHYLIEFVSTYLVGFLGMVIISKVPYQKFIYVSIYIYAAIVIMLILMNIGFGTSSYGKLMWLRIGSVSIQPTAVLPFGFLLAEAYFLKSKYKKVSSTGMVAGIWLIGIISAFLGMLLGHETSLGLMIMLMTYWIAAFSSGKVKKYIICFIAAVVILCGGFHLLKIYVPDSEWLSIRLAAFAFPEKYAESYGYVTCALRNMLQGTTLFGNGVGSSAEFVKYIPDSYSDNFLAFFTYEFGIVGLLFVLVAYFILVYNFVKLYLYNKSVFGSTFILGVILHITFCLLKNVLMIFEFIPKFSGSFLPFMSFGVNNPVLLMEVGVVLAISKSKKGQAVRG